MDDTASWAKNVRGLDYEIVNTTVKLVYEDGAMVSSRRSRRA